MSDACAYFTKMAQNNAWANDTLFRAVCAMAEAEVWATRPGYFGSIGATLNHVYEIDLYYLDALERGGQGLSVYDREDVRHMGELRALQTTADTRFIAFCQALDAETLAARVQTERKDGMTQERVDWLILHLIQHDVHHRGQVHAMLSHAGVKPPQLDDFYLDFGRVPTAQGYWETADG
ncbi:MAG: DinB family protein [Pseudomonadota bacterium]